MVTISKQALLVTALSAALTFVAAECPNGCSAHGQCGSHDMCTCDRNWQGPDCSQRVCPFGRAHVDIPKGDLDFSQGISSFNNVLITGSTLYPYGTTEGYPLVEDTSGTPLANSAHEYVECSNKGTCDRSLGECMCLPGYDGSACQRASCPNDLDAARDRIQVSVTADGRAVSRTTLIGAKTAANVQTGVCSGHGTCESIAALARLDGNNEYSLWDKDTTMGCHCDPGWSGPSCKERLCKYGVDPLYTDDTTARVTQSTVRFESTVSNALSGQYAIKFFDVFGNDHITKPLDISDGIAGNDVCSDVVAALKEFPNGIIPDIECNMEGADITATHGFEYTLTFVGNPGELKQLEIIEHLDGARPTVLLSSGTYKAIAYSKVSGEFVDEFSERCEGITVKILADSADSDNSWGPHVRPGSIGYLASPTGAFTTAEKKKLKACLGDSDYSDENNVDVSNWDKGYVVESNDVGTYHMIGAFPHAIKVVPVETTNLYNKYMNGHYHLVWFDPDAESDNKEFRVANLNDNANILSEATTYYVYTTQGTVQQMGHGNESPLQITDNDTAGVTASSSRITGYFDQGTNKIYTNYDTSCVNNPSSGNRNHACVEKGDKLFVVDSCWATGDLDVSGDPIGNPIFGGSIVAGCATSADVNYNTGNMYTVTKVYETSTNELSGEASDTIDITLDPSLKRYVNTFVIEVNANFAWTGEFGDPENSNPATSGSRDSSWSDNTGKVVLFHFKPADEGTYTYTSMCSNRGRCDKTSGLCQCFKGYTSDDCSVQNSLAK